MRIIKSSSFRWDVLFISNLLCVRFLRYSIFNVSGNLQLISINWIQRLRILFLQSVNLIWMLIVKNDVIQFTYEPISTNMYHLDDACFWNWEKTHRSQAWRCFPAEAVACLDLYFYFRITDALAQTIQRCLACESPPDCLLFKIIEVN